MRKLFLLFFVMLALSITVHAQNRTITGTVTGKDDNQPLVGVTIGVKGSLAATATDVNGKYSIKVTNLQSVVLTVKYIGYDYQELTIKPGQAVADFKLSQSTKDLAEVAIVATGYGNTLKSKILGSVAEIKGAEIEDLPVANLGTALMNRIAGVSVSVAGGSGRPGATTTLTLQGAYAASAVNGITTDPLYVIDGLIAQKSDFDNLDASLVESIAFLKDAQAAIYGAAADKGVVLVTTKKGKPGKPQISYTGYFGTSTAAFKPKMLSGLQQATAINDILDLQNAASNTKFSQADLDFIASNPYPSWYSQLWHSAQVKRHTINISGGSERVTFFGGGSYYDEGSNFGTTAIKKYNIRSGMTAKITDDITAYISLNTGYNTDTRNTAKTESGGSDYENTTFGAILQVPNWVPLYINGLPNYWTGPSATGSTWNPGAYFDSGSYATSSAQVINLNSSIDFHPHAIKGLTVKVQFGKSNYQNNAKNYYVPYTLYNFNTTGQNGALYTTTLNGPKTISNSNQYLVSAGSSSQYELIGSVDYSRTIKQHTFDVLVVGTQNETNATAVQLYRTTQQIPGVDQLFAFDPTTTTLQQASNTENGNLGYVLSVKYDYASKYLMQFIDRIDGSSNFAPGKRFGSSPAIAVGWRVSEEDFFKRYLSKYINSLKIRYNIGITGDNRVTAFLYKSRFTTSSNTNLFGTSVSVGLDPNQIANPDITWEHNRSQTLGFDASFLNDHLTLSVDVWNKHYYDGLLDITAQSIFPWTFGNSVGVINYNQANTWGTNVTIGYNNRINKDWSFNANVNFGWGDSQTTQALYAPGKLGGNTESQDITLGELSSIYNGTNYGLQAKGIIRNQAQLDGILAKNPNYTINGIKPQLGFMDFVDVNGDGKITTDADETQLFKNTTPLLSMGWTWGVSYKALKLNVNGFLQLGGKVAINDRTAPTSATVNSAGSLNQPVFWADHWTPSNPDATYPRADAPLLSENSTFWIRSGTRLYINNASLSYNLPKAWGDRLKIPNLRLVLTGENLWAIINPFDYKDVRTDKISTYPMVRTFSLGVNLTL
ncbi:MAG: SusC/RagA family TonB-linked outer membrane protein [Mucilaginibacter sp.]|uniref:SusC/RagA family TonB-linked outer membrane protein n=1 Tax=Mucilaginibacter sp. TaxID=1882438 RepID=UPI0032631BF5